MRLYYLTSEKWAKVVLAERRVKLSNIDELNDPFELLGAFIGEKRARKVVKYTRTRLGETFGLVCMSDTWQNPVMWAHYGDKHKGVCLGFDVPNDAPKQVQYKPARLTQLLGDNPTLADINPAVLEALLTTKYKDWSYEREWRLIMSFKHASTGADGKHFLPFYEHIFALREVILGDRCEWTLKDAAKVVGKVSKIVALKKVRPSFREFEMVRDLRQPVLHVRPASL
ncbi:MAG: hypothetical protein A3J24_03920 [Deltaproteobacteria bacterium RIFCSPLOWO2_02_FULL_53_8]|nr:MAG: hypothetical protein A3J24_03920 [Deltaproteobacteria bacterium RIFCSPLOWO2_02_FULL_53_8]